MSKRVSIGFGLVFLALLMGLLIVACGPAKDEATATVETASDQPAELDGKALAEERCTGCHNLDRVEAAEKTADEWKTSVERMVGKGAELNEAEQAAVIEYLSEAYPK